MPFLWIPRACIAKLEGRLFSLNLSRFIEVRVSPREIQPRSYDPGNFLGDRMFDLYSRVTFDKEVLVSESLKIQRSLHWYSRFPWRYFWRLYKVDLVALIQIRRRAISITF